MLSEAQASAKLSNEVDQEWIEKEAILDPLTSPALDVAVEGIHPPKRVRKTAADFL